MMAEASLVPVQDATEQELTCSICLDLFTDPVSTPCGHNFCQGCIGGYWASSQVCTCPLCKRQFDERPLLSINRIFAHITEQYKAKLYGDEPSPWMGMAAMSSSPTAAGGGCGGNTNPFLTAAGLPYTEPYTELVMCDVCSGMKRPAVSSCLTCTASYCEEHVQPHRATAFYASHRLLDPQEALKGRTCTIHRRLMEVYCRTCQRCICAICVLEEHRRHKTVSVQTERLCKQKLIGKTEIEIQNRIEGKNRHLTDLKEKLDGIRTYASAEQGELESQLEEVTQAVERIRAELVGGIQDKRAAVEAKGEALVSRLEAELSQMREKRSKLGAQATSQDHILFLQDFAEASVPLDTSSDLGEVDEEAGLFLHFQLGEVKSALGEVRERLDDIRMGEVRPRCTRGSRGSITSYDGMMNSESMMSVRGSIASMRKSQWSLKGGSNGSNDMKKIKPSSGLKKIRPYLVDVTLNPVTAYPFLILSEDRKQVKRGEKLQFYRNSSHRYDVWSCVIAKEGFNSGRHYWEVSVGENKDWKVGVVSESAQRKGLFDMSPANGYYAIWLNGSHLRALTAPPLTKIKTSGMHLRRVGVFLDVEGSQLTFYNAKTGHDLYSFMGAEFSGRMFPLLGTGDKEQPLVLMTTQITSPPE